MEYKYQIGEIVFAGNITSVVTAHGVYLDGENVIPSYHVTAVNEAIGTRTLPLTDTRIHRNSSMKSWLREDQLCGHDDYVSGLIQKLEREKIEGERLLRDTEEKIKWFKGLLNPGNDSPSGYVIRTHMGNGDFVGYTTDATYSWGASYDYPKRKLYPNVSEAAYYAAKYNEINSKGRHGVEYYCYAVVIPDGTEEECLKAIPVWEEEE